MNQREALKLALEALENFARFQRMMMDGPDVSDKLLAEDYAEAGFLQGTKAITAIREALAEQETVLPGGGHVPAVPVAVYGYCPECGGAGVMRERRPNGDDKCTNGHKYPSSKALAEQPAQPEQCECPACKVTPHASDCAVHNEPAYPKGACNCGAKPEQEPVANASTWFALVMNAAAELEDASHCLRDEDAKRVAISGAKHYRDAANALYTTPPHRKPWVGLTSNELQPICDEYRILFGGWVEDFARAIEAKLREKNHG